MVTSSVEKLSGRSFGGCLLPHQTTKEATGGTKTFSIVPFCRKKGQSKGKAQGIAGERRREGLEIKSITHRDGYSLPDVQEPC